MATKAEVEQELAEAQERIAELEAGGGETASDSDLPDPTEDKEKILKELQDADGPQEEGEDTYMVSVWSHRLESPAFVRAFMWARKRGNELKACLVYADSKELDFEESVAPVVKRD